MDIISLNYTSLRSKTAQKIKNYLNISKNNQITIGMYFKGKFYLLGNCEEQLGFRYDIGSISKTFATHLILKLYADKKLDISHTIDMYLPLKKGKYPTLYQLLTHTAGYHHLTPIEITLPHLALRRYSVKNPYENCTAKTVIKSLESRRFFKPRVRYGYSDFSFAVLAVVAEVVAKKSFDELFQEFVKCDLGLKNTNISLEINKRIPLAVKGKRILPFWVWKKQNPYIASGGMVTNIEDVLRYIALQI